MLYFDGVGLFMACFTIDGNMLAFQRIIGSGMVKSRGRLRGMKRLLSMTFQAIGSEFVVVHIFMAIRTVLVPDPCKFLKFLAVSFR